MTGKISRLFIPNLPSEIMLTRKIDNFSDKLDGDPSVQMFYTQIHVLVNNLSSCVEDRVDQRQEPESA